MALHNLTISEWHPEDYQIQNYKNLSIDYISFFTGIFVALLPVVLNIFWEKHKFKIQEKNNITAIVNELRTNITILVESKHVILNELQMIESGRSIVVPILELNHDFSSFLIINCPTIFQKDTELLKDIRELSKLTNNFNNVIQSRESYRINNGAMSNYNAIIKIYDENLQRLILELGCLLPSFISKLEIYIK